MALRFFCDQVFSHKACFDAHEVAHLRSMRKNPGDLIEFTDGIGWIYRGVISEIGPKKAIVSIQDKTKGVDKEGSRFPVWLCLAISRWNREAVMIEKASELGVQGLVIYRGERSQRASENPEKVRFVLRNALKQCGGTVLPETIFLELLSRTSIQRIPSGQWILLDPSAPDSIHNIKANPGQITVLWVGPEGGFSKEETQLLFELNTRPFHLGNRILRLETAAIVSLGYLMIQRADCDE
jgi:16S rRNA (uracil1498-N3)-methyltransferase